MKGNYQHIYLTLLFLSLPSFSSLAQVFSENWEFTTVQNIQSKPAYFQGKVFVSDGENLYAISDEGKLLWKLPGAHGDISINSSGDLYVKRDGFLNSVSLDGKVNWQTEISNKRILIGRDDSIYTSDEAYIYNITSSGELRWKRDANRLLPLAIDSDETLYFATENHTSPNYLSRFYSVFAYSNEGYLRWKRDIADFVDSYGLQYSIALTDSTVYLTVQSYWISYDQGGRSVDLIALSKNGEVNWKRPVEGSGPYHGSAPDTGGAYLAIDIDGDIIVKGLIKLLKITPSGDLIWTSNINQKLLQRYDTLYDDGFHFSTPVNTNKNNFFISGLNGIGLIDSEGELIEAYDEFNGENGVHLESFTPVTLTSTEKLYFGYRNKLLSFNVEQSLSNSSWPTQFQNNNHASRLELGHSLLDSDIDGIPDSTDPDNDNDGAIDTEDDAPLDASISIDNDNDGIDDTVDNDDDNDGVVDSSDVDKNDAAFGTYEGSGTYRWGINSYKTFSKNLYLNRNNLILQLQYSANANIVSIDPKTLQVNWELDLNRRGVRVNKDSLFVCHKPSYRDKHDTFSRYDSNGQVQWIIENTQYCSDFAVDNEGSSYIVDEGTLQKVSFSGNVLWTKEISANRLYTPIISSSFTLVVADETGLVFSIDGEGNTLWQIQLEGDIQAKPSIIFGNGGEIFILTEKYIQSISLNSGVTRGINEFENYDISKIAKMSGLVLDSSNNLFFTAYSHGNYFLFSVNGKGELNWKTDLGSSVNASTPSIDKKGNLYLLFSNFRSELDIDRYVVDYIEDRYLQSYSKAGVLNWRYKLADTNQWSSLYSKESPILMPEGYVVASARNGKTVAVNAAQVGLDYSSWPTSGGTVNESNSQPDLGSKLIQRDISSHGWKLSGIQGRYESFSKEMDFSNNADWTFQSFSDINGDGHKDLLQRHKDSGQWYAYLLSNFDVIDKGYIRITSTWNWQLVDSGDYDGDGNSDLLLRHKDGHWILYFLDGRRVKSYIRPEFALINDWKFEGAGDFNGDGYRDVMVRHKRTFSPYMYLLNKGEIASKGYTYLGQGKTSEWDIAKIADVDGDNISDIIKRNPVDGEWAIEFVDSRLVRETIYPDLTRGSSWHLIQVEDFDSDGQNDLLMQNQVSGKFYQYFLENEQAKLKGYLFSSSVQPWLVPKKFEN